MNDEHEWYDDDESLEHSEGSSISICKDVIDHDITGDLARAR